MKIRFGYEIVYSCPQPLPMILMLRVHASRSSDLLTRDEMKITPPVATDTYTDVFGNTCTRIVAPAGSVHITADAVIEDNGLPEPSFPEAKEHPVEELPHDTLLYLLGSRYCETQHLMYDAWRLFGHVEPGWSRVQAVCDFANRHIAFGYHFARSTKTAQEAYFERQGVCRDYAHLVIALLRALDIPARLAAVYAPGLDPMDFHAVAEAAVDGRWRAVDATLLAPRSSLVRIATGRDAADTSFLSTYGGAADLLRTEVTAVVDGQLPSDDVTALVSLS